MEARLWWERTLAALACCIGASALGQAPDPLDPGQPRPLPLFPADPQRPPQVAPPPNPQARNNPAANRNITASAHFEPPVLRLKQFGEYLVRIVGTASGINLPDLIPTPDGLILDLTDKTPGVTMLNGQRTMTMTFRYSVTASRPGSFVVPGFTATVQGTQVSVPPAQVIVQEPSASDLAYQPARAVLDLAPGEYFVGQMLPARLLVLDTPDEAVQAIANITKPSGDFLFQSQTGSSRERVVWEGKPTSAMVSPLRLIPIKPGETDISVQTIVFVSKLNAAGRPSGNTAQALLDTESVRVRVRALPDTGRKPGFTGAIGKFELGNVRLSASEVVVGDPVNLTVTIAGNGNLEAIGAPPVESTNDWQTFNPTMEVNRDVFTGRGTKTFTYTIIPRRADLRSVPAIPFSYFDPERKEYIDLSVPPQTIQVVANPAAMPAPGAPPAPGQATTAEALAESPPVKPAEPILTGLAESPGAWRWSISPISWSPWFWAVQAAPALALLSLWMWRRRTDYLEAHPEVVRRRIARAAARKSLRAARSAVRKRDAEAFVHASIDAIRAAAAPLDTTQAESLVLQEVLAKIPHEHGADEVVRKLFERAHAKDFSGQNVPPNGALDLLPQVERTVAVIEKHQP